MLQASYIISWPEESCARPFCLAAVSAAVLFILVLGIGKAFAQEVPVPVDVKPGSCPNPINVNSHGVLPVAILGTADFDVTQVDPLTVLLAGVMPVRSALEDVATPFDPFIGKTDALDCNELGEDLFLDLTLKFRTREIMAALGDVMDGDVLVLTLTGLLMDESPIIGEDVVLILKKGNGGGSALAPGRNK